ncbi:MULTISPECIES: 3-methyladenine DNA glycosylase [unclassified Arthrobacter]|uniref:3-methyladenine DNA glycosylase n=1 Tax=unclassified Arthrobacter TaxID=235627 RepID=UPI0024DFF2F5|nr:MULTISPECIES: 3-methyladenine DNA glycosylase [unclassified Arthrobacter]MCC9144075.1 3-methyladenine DNA glycosylase [Arthrobacter sp. zg-Y919]MDK1275300.1 3-methyladenine DNA glycosylase [Arthrobacter sp. zg.Y919]WIB04458.1 3-methyladenine DNA glycosylase [Arthrobacter sp. zg-Y919]
MAPARPAVLTEDQWLPRQAAHEARVRPFTEGFLARRSAGRKHPVEDFLFTYYSQKPGQLLRWHPGAGVVLSGPAAMERVGWKFYRTLTDTEREAAGLDAGTPAVTVDLDAFAALRGDALGFTTMLLSRTAGRKPVLGCFGMHEWAMAYKSEDNGIRHDYLQLRLGATGTDELVERSRIRCTHFDAFRFYTPEAAPLNELTPTRENQRDLEQPGCLHANMDLYKWAYKLVPLLPSELVMDTFELSWRIREMDMRASPYELADWGYTPIAVETPAGRAEYVAAQRGFTEESQQLRARILSLLEPFGEQLAAAGSPGPA